MFNLEGCRQQQRNTVHTLEIKQQRYMPAAVSVSSRLGPCDQISLKPAECDLPHVCSVRRGVGRDAWQAHHMPDVVKSAGEAHSRKNDDECEKLTYSIDKLTRQKAHRIGFRICSEESIVTASVQYDPFYCFL